MVVRLSKVARACASHCGADPSAELGAGYFQETHPETLFKECSHYCELASGANQMPRVLEIAIRQAVGNRGVSVVVTPGDIALQPAADAPPPKLAGLLPSQPFAIAQHARWRSARGASQ